MNYRRETTQMGVPARHLPARASPVAGGSRALRRGGRATWQPQGVGAETNLNGTSQGPTREDARKAGHSCGRSRPFMKYPG